MDEHCCDKPVLSVYAEQGPSVAQCAQAEACIKSLNLTVRHAMVQAKICTDAQKSLEVVLMESFVHRRREVPRAISLEAQPCAMA